MNFNTSYPSRKKPENELKKESIDKVFEIYNQLKLAHQIVAQSAEFEKVKRRLFCTIEFKNSQVALSFFPFRRTFLK